MFLEFCFLDQHVSLVHARSTRPPAVTVHHEHLHQERCSKFLENFVKKLPGGKLCIMLAIPSIETHGNLVNGELYVQMKSSHMPRSCLTEVFRMAINDTLFSMVSLTRGNRIKVATIGMVILWGLLKFQPIY